ncbi:hypothetical protein [uncultured Duncaniella sp.]|uniref:hypothetical protein n=2 Tax=uncultured Duncaniella sp. TaxID=2768039 RepID=UPI0025A971B6|nr:hypothetical protein [uncultured Duncaniella sp.]
MKNDNKQAPRNTTIMIGDRKLPCRVTMGAMVRYKRQTGRDISSLDTSDIEGMVLFLWCCVVSACRADGVEFTMDFEEFGDRLEPADLTGFYEGMHNAVPTEEKKTVGTPAI